MSFELDFLWVGLMQVVGFFVQGCTGFGGTTINTPVTTGLLGTAAGVPYGTLMTIPFLYYLGIKFRHSVAWKDLLKIVIFCAPGLFFGNILFYKIDETTAKICLGTMITGLALVNCYKHIVKPLILKIEEPTEVAPDTTAKKAFRYGCLLLGGVVHGAFNIGGALITVYTLEAVKEKEKFRNTMNWVWVVLNTINACNQYRNGAYTPYMLSAVLVGLPMAAIGFFAGMKFLEKINREQFLRIVYVVLLIVGGDMLIRNLLVVL
ncbi:sulfite exporter TauE/SafE family protein [Chakrabartyella piscis]|uniref:sulfite exporter TauE/SafE family protein n=1 Tax=Chakrabartyella piscis TaxID=2918914 RepID=UPI0029589A36|nr:sulfite exporter TauE/SafE family protein [Chakrabartyella piscis]